MGDAQEKCREAEVQSQQSGCKHLRMWAHIHCDERTHSHFMPFAIASIRPEIDLHFDEAAAIAALRRKDPGGLDALVKLHQLKAVQTAYLVVGDRATAEDMVADAFVTVFQKIEQFDSARPFWPWFCRIVMNNALQWLRKNKTLQAWDDIETLPSDAATPIEQSEAADRRRRILTAVNLLAPEQRAVIVMRYFHCLDDREIASTLGVPHATVRWRMHRAKQKLRATLDKDPALRGTWEEDR